ncbi:MAG TPA: ABC transporter substrate binding protein, partial [Gammaproteobacteria bacterium]|nr:ABC transporter substrate binding protein [Gammaproteobacteria bacterium]
KRLSGKGTLAGIRNALQTQLNDPSVDLVIVLGVVASEQASQIPTLNKPVIAAWVLDQKLQGLPYIEGTSGKPNFTYLTTTRNIPEEIAYFQDMVGFKHLAVLINPFWLEALPQLQGLMSELENKRNITIQVVKAQKDITQTLKQLSPKTDAVFVAPLAHYSDDNIRALAGALIAQGLPSFSAIGRYDVELGLLAAKGGMPEDKIRFARRLALDVQSILLGDDPRDLDVMFLDNAKLILNMKTAQSLGYSPPWRYMLDAILLNQEQLKPQHKLSLQTAMQMALRANLQLQVNELSVEVAEENVELARANLLPQLFAMIENTQVDSNDPLSVIGIAENMTTGVLGGQQSLYSDSFWAEFRVAQYLEEAEDYKLYRQILDTLANTGVAYLDVLRAMAVQDVREA